MANSLSLFVVVLIQCTCILGADIFRADFNANDGGFVAVSSSSVPSPCAWRSLPNVTELPYVSILDGKSWDCLGAYDSNITIYDQFYGPGTDPSTLKMPYDFYLPTIMRSPSIDLTTTSAPTFVSMQVTGYTISAWLEINYGTGYQRIAPIYASSEGFGDFSIGNPVQFNWTEIIWKVPTAALGRSTVFQVRASKDVRDNYNGFVMDNFRVFTGLETNYNVSCFELFYPTPGSTIAPGFANGFQWYPYNSNDFLFIFTAALQYGFTDPPTNSIQLDFDTERLTSNVTFTPGTYYYRFALTDLRGVVTYCPVQNFTVAALPTVGARTVPFSENFENGAIGWSSFGSIHTWKLATPSVEIFNGTVSGNFSFLFSPYTDMETGFLFSPPISFPNWNANETAVLNFWLNFDTEASYDGVVVQYSLDGLSWNLLGSSTGFYNGYLNWVAMPAFTGPLNGQRDSGYHLRSVELPSSLRGRNNIRIRFYFISDGSVIRNGAAIDDLSITLEPNSIPVAVPTNQTRELACNMNIAPTALLGEVLAFSVAPANSMGDIPQGYYLDMSSLNNGTVTSTTRLTVTSIPLTQLLFQFMDPNSTGVYWALTAFAGTRLTLCMNETLDLAGEMVVRMPYQHVNWTEGFESNVTGLAVLYAPFFPISRSLITAGPGSGMQSLSLHTGDNVNLFYSTIFDFSDQAWDPIFQFKTRFDLGNDGFFTVQMATTNPLHNGELIPIGKVGDKGWFNTEAQMFGFQGFSGVEPEWITKSHVIERAAGHKMFFLFSLSISDNNGVFPNMIGLDDLAIMQGKAPVYTSVPSSAGVSNTNGGSKGATAKEDLSGASTILFSFLMMLILIQ